MLISTKPWKAIGPPKSDNRNNSNYSHVKDFDGNYIYIYILYTYVLVDKSQINWTWDSGKTEGFPSFPGARHHQHRQHRNQIQGSSSSIWCRQFYWLSPWLPHLPWCRWMASYLKRAPGIWPRSFISEQSLAEPRSRMEWHRMDCLSDSSDTSCLRGGHSEQQCLIIRLSQSYRQYNYV